MIVEQALKECVSILYCSLKFLLKFLDEKIRFNIKI